MTIDLVALEDGEVRPVRQLMQSIRSGELSLSEVPMPTPGPTQVLVATSRSVVSAGTERAVNQLASANLAQKAKARPDLVRQVISKARAEGIRSTAQSVRSKLDDQMPLGYSGVGVAVDVGEHVDGIRPGMRVATGGAGHGDYQLVSGLLAVPVPDNVSDTNAAFATVASIAMHGLRLAELGPGSRVCVIGLGLVGQITCRLAQAAGYLVSGIDVKDHAIAGASESGVLALSELDGQTTRIIREWSKGRGVDAVLITAASKSSGPVARAAEIARDRASVVVVGDVGLELDRRPFYHHELTLKVARSYGPGRYERAYEDWAVDYPAGQVRWTEGRNLESVLDLLSAGKVDFSDLVTHEFELADMGAAYSVIDSQEPFFGVQLTYPPRSASTVAANKTLTVGVSAAQTSRRRVGIIGAGNFVKATLLPAIKASPLGPIQVICSAGGTSARFLADKHGIPKVSTSSSDVINDPDVDLVVIATPHDTHAELVIEALNAGKHVFCEKPLAMNEEELDRIEAAWLASGRVLHVGFNRRHSPAAARAKAVLGDAGGPLVITYRVNAGELPEDHWYKDRRFGGRLIGEACHYIDFCGALNGDTEPEAHVFGSGLGEQQLDEDFVISLRYPNGGVATISYASGGHPGMPKEQIDIVGRGHAISINDFKDMTIDGKRQKGVGGRGHPEQLEALERTVNTGCSGAGAGTTQSTRLSLRAAASGVTRTEVPA